jgi:hypothetical protein
MDILIEERPIPPIRPITPWTLAYNLPIGLQEALITAPATRFLNIEAIPVFRSPFNIN